MVIAIGALLLGVLMPAFADARKRASNVIYLSNEQQLTGTWIIYVDVNDGLLFGSGTSRNKKVLSRMQSPQDAHGSFDTLNLQSGIRRGRSYPFADDNALVGLGRFRSEYQGGNVELQCVVHRAKGR